MLVSIWINTFSLDGFEWLEIHSVVFVTFWVFMDIIEIVLRKLKFYYDIWFPLINFNYSDLILKKTFKNMINILYAKVSK